EPQRRRGRREGAEGTEGGEEGEGDDRTAGPDPAFSPLSSSSSSSPPSVAASLRFVGPKRSENRGCEGGAAVDGDSAADGDGDGECGRVSGAGRESDLTAGDLQRRRADGGGGRGRVHGVARLQRGACRAGRAAGRPAGEGFPG